MTSDSDLRGAIRAGWTAATSATPDEWSAENPAKGQCDVSSYVYWEHRGGELVVSEVLVDGVRTEHHYTNRIDGVDIDITESQFDGSEEIRELAVLDAATIRERSPTMRAELADRIAMLRSAVAETLGDQ